MDWPNLHTIDSIKQMHTFEMSPGIDEHMYNFQHYAMLVKGIMEAVNGE